MDRLTGWDGDHAYLLKCFEGGDCVDMGTSKCENCEHNVALFDRMAAYEDTGLTPEEISTLKAERNMAITDIKQACETCGLRKKPKCPWSHELVASTGQKIGVCNAWQWRGIGG